MENGKLIFDGDYLNGLRWNGILYDLIIDNIYELKKELKILEREIMKKEIEVVALNNELTKEEVYTDIEEANRLSKQLKEIQKELDKLNLQWEKLTDKIVGGNNE